MKNARILRCLVCLFAVSGLMATPRPVAADVRLPGFFNDHMVIQQQMPVRIHGWAEVGEAVTVTINEASSQTVTPDSGRWQVELPAMTASFDPVTITVQGSNTLTINDVLVGEVWLCSGQSNMEWTVARSSNAAQEIAAASYPMIRHIKIGRQPSTRPQDDVSAAWQICSPETVASFTACGYFMARQLQAELNVPIGLINSSWGGTRVEPWTPPVGFAGVPALQDISTSVSNRTPGTPGYQSRMTAHLTATENWLTAAQQALQSGTDAPPQPAFPAELTPFKSHQDPTMLYNGMIHALVGYPIRGAIWYQGESNHNEGMLYFEKKKALINGWRQLWGQGEFPFYFVQIAPFQYGNEDPTILARFWEAQAAVQQLPNTGMVVINDIATIKDIHPPNKQDVGLRLANLALHNDYGKTDVICESPSLLAVEAAGDSLKVTFTNTAGGLKTRDGQAPSHFEVVGPGSGGFQPASATIDGDSVILKSDKAENPTAFRFAWHKTAEPNLTGGTGLPVGAVRGGEMPEFADLLPIKDQYTLVYDLDLSKLGRNIVYDQDQSASTGAFDRVAYLLELTTADGTDQRVFAAMDAFTSSAGQLGVPTAASGFTHQRPVTNLQIFSTVAGVASESIVPEGNVEFWPHNYGTGNDAKVKGASGTMYDFGDAPSAPVDGYGCMQVHNTARRQTVFAINHWGVGDRADIGIGNSSGAHRDWTFTGNAATYTHKRLRIYVRPVE